MRAQNRSYVCVYVYVYAEYVPTLIAAAALRIKAAPSKSGLVTLTVI